MYHACLAFSNVSSRYCTHPVHQLTCGSIPALLVYNLNFLSLYHVLWVVFPSRTELSSHFSNLWCGQYKIEWNIIAQIWLDLVLPRAWITSNQNILVFITKSSEPLEIMCKQRNVTMTTHGVKGPQYAEWEKETPAPPPDNFWLEFWL